MKTTLTTDEFAKEAHVKPSSIRTRLCNTGSFHGVKPIKLPTGRLLWRVTDLNKMLEGAN